ncbi:MAG: hypothetical protein MJ105_06585 [Lachnospiraceae bacterium]|nr:hypothetical protein [Lachnospiraceae bacterium]
MKKTKLLGVLAAVLSVSLLGCGKNESQFSGQSGQGNTAVTTTMTSDGKKETTDTFEFVQVKPSPDKYTQYVKSYVGQNLANVGYTSLGGEKRDYYGSATILLSVITADGRYVDLEDDEDMKNYVVIEQVPEVNTEMKLTFEKDSKGEEYSNLIDSTSVEEIVLLVDVVGTKPNGQPTLTKIPTTGDHYHSYIKDYTGRNLGNVGYVSWGGELRDEYGEGSIKLNIVPDDGAYIDVEDIEVLKQYVVIAQDVAAGTELVFTYMTDSNGEEYSNLVDTMTYESVTLYVTKIQ